jgi:hypothetical protein
MSDRNQPIIIRGETLTEEELSMFKDYRAAYLPLARLKASDDFGKWLFSLSTVIGSLGVVFSNSSVFKLAGTGRILFAVAVALTGVSFALATLSLLIDVGTANPSAPDEMFAKVARILAVKRRLLGLAASSLMIGLILAGLAPGLSKEVRQKNGISYLLNGSSLDVAYLTPTAVGRAELRVDGLAPDSTVVLAKSVRIADPLQQEKLEITKISIPTNINKLTISAKAGSQQETPVEIEIRPTTTVATQEPSSKRRNK